MKGQLFTVKDASNHEQFESMEETNQLHTYSLIRKAALCSKKSDKDKKETLKIVHREILMHLRYLYR